MYKIVYNLYNKVQLGRIKKMRGNKEQTCLDKIRQEIFTNDGHPIYHPVTNKTYTEISDEEFVKEQDWFINSSCEKNYFGLLEEDRKEIAQILRLAKSNDNLNNFPDFVFDNGFIEHFQISSSKETRKGAKHIKQINRFNAQVNEDIEELKQEWNNTPSFDEVRSKHWAMTNPEHNHDFLIESFQKNWENHIESFHKYQGEKKIGIFLVEYTDFALGMHEEVYKDWINGMSQGDMREPESFKYYRLSRDKKLLNYLYKYRDEIKYVIFVSCNGYEIIQLDKIPYLLKLLPFEYNIYSMYVKTVSSLYNRSIKVDLDDKESNFGYDDESKEV